MTINNTITNQYWHNNIARAIKMATIDSLKYFVLRNLGI